MASDAQSGYRAFSARALAAARISHDYNYAQVLTLSLWGARIEPVEVPISYRRRTSGRSFVRYPEYLARVAPAIWREWRASRSDEEERPPGDRAGERERPVAVRLEHREQRGERAERSVGPVGHERAAEEAHVGVEPDAPASVSAASATPILGAWRRPSATSGMASGSAGQQVPRREPEAEHGGGEEGGHQQLGAEHGGAEAGGELDLAHVGHGAREAVAAQAPEPPEPGEGEQRTPAPSAAGRSRGR